MRERARRDERDGLPEPYTLIRAESIARFPPEQLPLDAVALIARFNWRNRFLSLIPEGGRTLVIPWHGLRVQIVERVCKGELSASQGERMRMFLELEATGEAESYYGAKRCAGRRREARKVGLRVEDAGREEHDFDLEPILRAYDDSPVWGEVGLDAQRFASTASRLPGR
jgi:hypothetical protein